MISGDGEEPLAHICVIGKLSVKNVIRFPVQLCPHVRVAARIANNSFKSIDIVSNLFGQRA